MSIRAVAVYSLMIIGTALAFLIVRSYGDQILAPAPLVKNAHFGSGGTANVDVLLHLLLALGLVIAVARALGTLFKAGQQPPVIGEIVAGILLGPSLLGHIAPAASAYLFPPAVVPFLNIISQIGVILYMFLVGLELDPVMLRRRGHATVAISHASIVMPFTLGLLVALPLYSRMSSSDVPFTNFALFLGVSMSVTAFPVLARILTDRRIHKTRIGAIALTCAAVDDITAWCLLAFVVSVAKANAIASARTVILAFAYIAVMIIFVRPAMARLSLHYGNRGRLTQGVMTIIFVALLASAAVTDLIGIHAIFGAFALGAVTPHDSGMARDISDRLEDVVVVLLLPAFFAFTGLRTEIGLIGGGWQWFICLLIIVAASVGKFGGSLIAARLTGLGWREGSVIGVLMNTRGLMELIVLNIGFEMGVISPTLFAMLVLMALATTLATTPLLHWITRGAPILPAESSRVPGVEAERNTVLVPVANPQGAAALVSLALAATPADAPPPRVLALVRRLEGVMSGVREIDEPVPPRSPALAAALEFALGRGALITPQAVWTDDPAADILRIASEPHIGWLLLGSHRSVFGSDFRGGVVREILDRARTSPLNVCVVLDGEQKLHERVYAVIDASLDGRAALELATRIGLRSSCEVHAVLVPQNPNDNQAFGPMLAESAQAIGRQLRTATLAPLTAARIQQQIPDGLIITSASLADHFGLFPDAAADGRSAVIVQGGRFTAVTSVVSQTSPV